MTMRCKFYLNYTAQGLKRIEIFEFWNNFNFFLNILKCQDKKK